MEKWVFHEKYGKGIVVKTRYLGFEQLIRFTTGIEKWIPSYKLKSVEISIQTNTSDFFGDKTDGRKDVASVSNVPRRLSSHNLSISFSEPPKTKSNGEYADIPGPNIPLYPPSYKTVIGFDEPIKTENTEQNDVVSEPSVLDVAHSYESNIDSNETIKIDGEIDVVSEPSVLDVAHLYESNIDSNETIKIDGEIDVVSEPVVLDVAHLYKSNIDSNETIKIDGKIDVVSEPGVLDVAHSYESNIDSNETIKTEITENTDVAFVTGIRKVLNSSGASIEHKDYISSRMIIEALRLGGVSHEQAEVFTYGRDREINNIKKWLVDKEGSLLINGEYGVGKTHLIEIVSSMAIENGWAVARVEIDPNEAPLHKPKQIYHHFVTSLSYKQSNKVVGLDEFIESIARSNNLFHKKRLAEHPYLGQVLIHWDDTEDKSWLLDWIKGNGSQPADFPQMPDFQTAANIYCNILSGFGWSAKNVLGLKGILILFDEAECVDSSWYPFYQFDKALRFLTGIILMSNNDKRLLKDSRELGLEYCDKPRKKYRYPYLWERESCIKLIFSFVPKTLDSMSTYPRLYYFINHLPIIDIDTLDDHDLQRILEEVIDVYEDAYDFKFDYDISDILPYLSRNKTRKFVKGAVECLDIMRFNPEIHPTELFGSSE